MNKKILILSFSPLNRDPRVHRQILALQDDYQLFTSGFTPPKINGTRFYPIDLSYSKNRKKYALEKFFRLFFIQTKKFEKAYWANRYVQDAWEKLQAVNFDMILANDVSSLPLAVKLADKNKAKILLDAHEYTPKNLDEKKKFFRSFFQNYWDWILRTYLPRINAMTTVAPVLAQAYEEEFGVKCDIILNTPTYEDLQPQPVAANKIKMIHHGGLDRYRQVENMVFLMDLLDDRFHLEFMLMNNNPGILKKIKSLAKGNPRISFRDPVPMTMISRTINKYDIGLFLLWPGTFSFKNALPNKLFEFIQGRLAIAIWPSPEMARIVRDYGLGVVSDDFSLETAAEQLNSLTPEAIWSFKMNSHKAAPIFCAEQSKDKLLGMIRGLIDS
jgi:hypothetical protein